MIRKIALAALILAPSLLFATPAPKNQKESVVVEVASIKTNTYTTHTRSTSWVMSRLIKDSYAYTDILFAVVNDEHIVYACAERDKACPVLDSGSKISAERNGNSLSISTTGPSEKSR